MGDTVSREVMSNFVHNNNSIVYNKSETEYDFRIILENKRHYII